MTDKLDSGSWQDVPEHYVQPMAVEKQKKLLLQLKAMLEGLVEQDQQKVIQLKEQLARLEHGGGV